jgi:hypothetical protein
MSDQIEVSETAKIFKGDMCMGTLSTTNRSTRLIATSGSIILDGPLGKRYDLPADKIERIEKGKFHIWFLAGGLFGCVRIYHTIEDYPEMLMFTGYFKKNDLLMRELKSLGYNVLPTD